MRCLTRDDMRQKFTAEAWRIQRRCRERLALREVWALGVSAIVILAAGLFAIARAQGPGGPTTIDAAMRTAVIEGAIKQLNDTYVFPDVAKKMETAIRDRMERGEYDKIIDAVTLARALTDHLREVSHDKHLRVNYSAGPIPERKDMDKPTTEERERMRAIATSMKFGFQKVERLEGNIGYLDLRGFMDAEMAAETAAAAMNFLAVTDALIIDLRNNGGGQPEMVALLCSYFFDKRTHLNDIYWRPTNKTTEFWTRDNVAGKRYGMKDLYVLTSQRTFSGAEEFTYNLKNLKRATIIGETTRGGAHPVAFRRINEHFGISVPAGRAINPITKSNWEGTGVTPDVEVPAALALKTAHVMALKKLASSTIDPMKSNQLKQALAVAQADLDELKKPRSEPQSGAASSSSSEDLPKLPDTPAAKTFAAFVAAFNSGSIEVMRRFHQERGGNLENAEQDLQFYNDGGGLKVHSVVQSTENEIEVLAQRKKSGNWVSFRMTVDPSPPHSAARISVQPAQAPTSAQE